MDHDAVLAGKDLHPQADQPALFERHRPFLREKPRAIAARPDREGQGVIPRGNRELFSRLESLLSEIAGDGELANLAFDPDSAIYQDTEPPCDDGPADLDDDSALS